MLPQWKSRLSSTMQNLVQVFWSILFWYTSQKGSFWQVNQLLYVWAYRGWKMGWVWIFSVYKTGVLHTKLLFLWMLRSSCTQGEKQLPRPSAGQTGTALWGTERSSMDQKKPQCKGSLLKEENQSAECPVCNPAFLAEASGRHCQIPWSWHWHISTMGRTRGEVCLAHYVNTDCIMKWRRDVKNRLKLDQGKKFVPITWILQHKQTKHGWIHGVSLLPCHWRAALPHHGASLRWSPCSSSWALLCMALRGAGLQHRGASLETKCRSSCQSA